MQAQRTTSPARQRGLSFIGVIFIGLLAVAAFAIGGQSIPIFLEYQAIKKAATKAARESSTVPEVAGSFRSCGCHRRHQLDLWQGPGSDQTWRQSGCVFQIFARNWLGGPGLSGLSF
jgi:hypothetical protein